MKQLVENIADDSKPKLGPATAVIAIHWQNDVVAPLGALDETFSESVTRTGVVRRTAQLLQSARSAGAMVIYVNVAFEKGYVGLVRNNALWNMVSKSNGFIRGTKGVEIVPALAPAGTDVILTHTRISAFFGTDLETVLVGNGIKSLFLTGVATNVAVDHTAKDAVQLGFNTYVVEDCCTSSDERYHEAAMLTLRSYLHRHCAIP